MTRENGLTRAADAVLLSGAVVLAAFAGLSKAMLELATALLIAGLALRVVSGGIPRVCRTFALLLGGWIVACAVSALLSSHPTISAQALLRKTLPYALLALAAADIGARGRNMPIVIAVFLLGSLVVAGDSAFQWATGHDALRGRPLIAGRITGAFSNPNDVASYFVAAAPIALWASRSARGAARWACVALAFMHLLGLAQTDSRAAWYGVIVALGVIGTLYVRIAAWGGLILAVATGFCWYRMGYGNAVWVDPGRYEAWDIALRMFLDHPWAGIGLGTFMANYNAYVLAFIGDWSRPQYAHNCYLQILAESGVAGLAAFLAVVAYALRSAASNLRRPEDAPPALGGMLAALVGVLINAALDTGLYSLPIATLAWFLLGMTVGLAKRPAGSTGNVP